LPVNFTVEKLKTIKIRIIFIKKDNELRQWEKILSELKTFEKINEKLAKDFLCLPPYSSINGGFINTVAEDLKANKEIKYHITSQIILPDRRALQAVYRYRELAIFKRVWNLIDFATLSYFKGNHVCAYLSLLPIIETLLREWHNEENNTNKKFVDSKNFIAGKIKFLKKKYPANSHYYEWLHTYYNFLDRIIQKVLFISDKKYEKDNHKDIFNRNMSLHYLKDIENPKMSLLNSVRLFLVIDVIAEIYLRENENKYDNLKSLFDPNYNDELRILYFKFYCSCSLHGLEHEHTNIINNVLSNETITHGKIEQTKATLKAMDNIIDIIRKKEKGG